MGNTAQLPRERTRERSPGAVVVARRRFHRCHHQPRSFHHVNPTTLQMEIVASDTRKPYFHHYRCVA